MHVYVHEHEYEHEAAAQEYGLKVKTVLREERWERDQRMETVFMPTRKGRGQRWEHYLRAVPKGTDGASPQAITPGLDTIPPRFARTPGQHITPTCGDGGGDKLGSGRATAKE